MEACTTALQSYLQAQGFTALRLRAVLFDMDGVLFNSMPAHAEAWAQVMQEAGFTFSIEEAYMHEGQTAMGTIDEVSRAQRGRPATQEEVEALYHKKTLCFNRFPQAQRMAGSLELLCKIKECGLTPMVVTGSGTASLLTRINSNFPHIFAPNYIISGKSVKRGKPAPDPYLKALAVGGFEPWEAIVVENAPLGIRSAVAARLFTIALNTGPLPDNVLWHERPSLVLPSMPALCQQWEDIYHTLTTPLTQSTND